MGQIATLNEDTEFVWVSEEADIVSIQAQALIQLAWEDGIKSTIRETEIVQKIPVVDLVSSVS